MASTASLLVTIDSSQAKDTKQRLLSSPEGGDGKRGLGVALKNAWEFAKGDARKTIFSLKLGISLSLISLLMFVKDDISTHSVWAILTVVVVFEFSIGATLSKGFNRGLGTLSAGGLALGVAELSTCTGEWESVILILSIFAAGSIVTFAKLYPKMRPYEYGFRVFLITFCFVMASGARTRAQFIHIAVTRFLLIALGAGTCLIINVCIYPIWAGEDLHKLIVKNCISVADSLERCIDGYLSGMALERVSSKILTCQAADDPIYSGYRSALVSATEEETLEGFASWEPPHGRYRIIRYPWKEYLAVGDALRHCASVVMALHGCMLSEIQASRDLRQVFGNELRRVSGEGAKVLREVGHNIEDMTKPEPGGDILRKVHEAAAELQKKIDTHSYLLVKSERWIIGDRSSGGAQSPRHHIMHRGRPRLGKSYSECKSRGEHVDSTTCDGNVHWTTIGNSSEVKFCKQRSWPSRRCQEIVDADREREGNVLESASALSVATFASLSIELVARLDGVVNSLHHLSLRAKFEDPNPSCSPKGFFGRMGKLMTFS